jgi:hypothetical protein
MSHIILSAALANNIGWGVLYGAAYGPEWPSYCIWKFYWAPMD